RVLARRVRGPQVDGRHREPVTPIAIPHELLKAIYAHAIAAFPEECCGYLIGRSPAAVDGAVACRNAQADGEHPVAPARRADTGWRCSRWTPAATRSPRRPRWSPRCSTPTARSPHARTARSASTCPTAWFAAARMTTRRWSEPRIAWSR